MNTRRNLLTLAASMTAALPMIGVGAAGQPHPDADLIAIAAEAEAAERMIYDFNHDRLVLTEDEVDDAILRANKFGGRLIGMRAITAEGTAAKARVLWLSLQNLVVNEIGETMESMGDPHDQLAWSLVNDILNGSNMA